MRKLSHKILVVFAIVYFAAATYAPSGNTLGLAQPYQYVVDESSDIFGKFTVSSIGSVALNRNYDVEITLSSIIIRGCNTRQSAFGYNSDTKVCSIGQWSSTFAYCQNDQDSIVTDAFTTARRVYKRGNGLIIF
jgi:hypothetical protein